MSYQRKRKKQARKKRGLLGIPDTNSPWGIALSTVGGLAAGILAGMGMDKLLPPEQYDTILKKLAKPGAIGAAAAAALLFSKDSNIVKGVGVGLSLAAAAAGIKNLANIDIFKGLGQIDSIGEENAKLIRELQTSFQPSLPALSSDFGNTEEPSQVSGPGEFTQVLGPEDQPFISGHEEPTIL